MVLKSQHRHHCTSPCAWFRLQNVRRAFSSEKKKKTTAGHISQPAPELLDFSFLLQLLIFVLGIIMTNKRKQGRCKRCLQGVLSRTLHYSTTNGSFSKRTYFSTYFQQAQSVKARQEISCSSPALCDMIFFPSGDHGLVLLCPYKTVSGPLVDTDTQPD